MFDVYSPARRALGALLSVVGLVSLAVVALTAAAQTPETVLQGYVFDYKGAFVAGASVTLYTMPAHVQVGQSTTTDANGTFTLDTGARDGTYAVRAEAPGYEFSEQTVFATSYETGLTFILRAVGAAENEALVATISGRVTSLNDVPLGGMSIVATDRQDTGVRQQASTPVLNATVTDADGNYSLRIPAGAVWLTLKTGAAWGYQLQPINVTAGQTIAAADFKAAIRVLPRTEFPTATAVPLPTAPPPTATPISAVSPIVGMPATGAGPDNGFNLGLAGLGLLTLLLGLSLSRRAGVTTRR